MDHSDVRAQLQALSRSPEYLDNLYAQYRQDPATVEPHWAELFARFDRADADQRPRRGQMAGPEPSLASGLDRTSSAPGIQIYDLVHTYRAFGHLIAQIDPLGRSPREHPLLELSQFGFTAADLDQPVSCEGYLGTERATVREFIELLRETYSGPIGVEYMDVTDAAQRDWLHRRIEPVRNRPRLATAERAQILRELIAADTFEQTLQQMYPGSKRFSLEGGTTLITLLSTVVRETSAIGVQQLVIGMAHRGRLNVLAHVLGKPLEYILAEFEGRPLPAEVQGYGDVKYHMGYSADHVGPSGQHLHLSLAYNPSHLETVNPVVEGIVRAKQRLLGDAERTRVVPLLIHGDAAFAGQGVVAETLTLADLEGYTTGGTLHVIVNNQVGFTASPRETRSTRYASDIAKLAGAPVFHVNADHPEAVVHVAQMALAYRQAFRRDVVIDLVCFRRHGHNELDDPSYTQPVESQLIEQHPPVSQLYADRLVMAGIMSQAEVDGMIAGVRERLRAARETARAMPAQVSQRFGGVWRGLGDAGADWSAHTAVPAAVLQNVAEALLRVPTGFTWHPRLRKLMETRVQKVRDEQPIDWGCAEALAFGSLLLEGRTVRLSGQDVGRGTFSHRHAVYSDLRTGARHVPLDALAPGQARFEVVNSPLSEEAVLGFEYGYSSADPWTLVVWEAQFGDFVNGAQVIVDQLLASAEYKWGRMSGLVLLLPHGYEGQGPEHSSARLERFLELCAEDNLQVGNFTTPAQYFHALRRQLHRNFRKPLVVMSPKSLLRHPQAVSPLRDFTDGRFCPVLDDPAAPAANQVQRVLLCSGKIYYALAEYRAGHGISDTAIVRLEQLYPYPRAELRSVLERYGAARQFIWVQEEPRNMGAWRNLLHRLQASIPAGGSLEYAGRDSRAVPATGSFDVHQREEAELLQAAFDPAPRSRVIRRLPAAEPARPAPAHGGMHQNGKAEPPGPALASR